MNDKLKQTKALPISLLLEGRPCIVVGGGKIAARKAQHLLDAGAVVTVVSPAFCDAFDPLPVNRINRPFEATDARGNAVAFACTNDRYVNRQVLAACRAQHVLCCCADGNWADGDFTTPATSHHRDLTLTVSTGGRSCRQAKLVKNSLVRHIESVETADLIVIGTDHRHLDAQTREPFHLCGERFERIGFMLMQIWGVHEFMLLNTCNRVEIIAIVSREAGTNGILRHALGFDRLAATQYYLKRGAEAWEHTALVCAGMYSQTPGETHIAGQLKAAVETAVEHGWAAGLIREWISAALHLSKHIKNEIVIPVRGCEIEDCALRYVRETVPALETKTILILGTGEVGQGLLRDAAACAGRIIWCYHRNRPSLPEHITAPVELCTFNELKDRLREADVILCAVDAEKPVIHCGHAPFFDSEKDVLLVDLGMPRNIDPALDAIDSSARRIDLDSLKQWFLNESPDMNAVLQNCRSVILNHREDYERLINRF